MGCDIHMHGEVKIKGEWHHFGVLDGNRRYEIFALMADVRNMSGIKPISEPRGLPKDATFLTKWDSDRWEGDGHSHSWLGLDELKQVLSWYEETAKKERNNESVYAFGSEFFGNSFYWVVTDSKEELLEKGIADVRAVFWFDN